MNSYKTSKTILSIFLSLILIASTATIAFAVEALAVKNVSQWPTISYKAENGTLVSDGYMYYGQKVSDVLVINDDEIVLNAAGEQVAGHFEFIDPNEIPDDINDAMRSNIKFVPDDTDMYTGFQRKRSRDTTFKVVATTPVLVSDAPTATSVDSGSSLSASVISGGQVINPYYPEETSALNAKWSWSNPDTVIYESGEYEAKLYIHTAYVEITKMIYVEVNSTVKATTIAELPTAEIEFAQELTYNDLVLNGGKAVEYGTETEVSGLFSVKNPNAKITGIGTYNVPVVFTPDDLEKYTPCEGTAVVTVTKANYKLVNENGEEVTVPEFTMSYGTTLGMVPIQSLIKDRSLLTGADIANVYFPSHEKDEIIPVGTNTYAVRIYPNHEDYSSYKRTDLQFVITIEPVVITTTAYWAIGGTIGGKVSHDVQGTVDVFVDGELVGDDIKITRNKDWSFDYPIPATGDYTLKVVYNPIENDPHSMEDYETVVNVRMIRKIILPEDSRVTYKVNGDERTSIMRLGDTIELSTFGGDLFRGWKIADASGNIVDLGVADLMANQITFTMPDHDLYIEAQYEKEVVDDGNGGLDIDNIFGDLDLDNLTQGDSDNPFENLLNNIIALFKNIIEKITGFFRAIGDKT